MDHVVMMSGGAGSWAAGKRVVERYGAERTTLLFADTKFEDEDTYRYLKESAENIGAKLEIIADGRDIWQVFVDARFMGNSRIDPCSAKLKREICDRWIKERYRPDEVIVYVGIDWTEVHRYERMAERKKPYVYESPLLWEPQIAKPQILEWSKAEGIKQQRLYDMGMPHANCGGGCIKAGQAHWKHLWETWPERYQLWEDKEQWVYEQAAKAEKPWEPKPFLSVTRNGEKEYLSLKQFREQVLEPGGAQCDLFDWGGCGCFIDSPEE